MEQFDLNCGSDCFFVPPGGLKPAECHYYAGVSYRVDFPSHFKALIEVANLNCTNGQLEDLKSA